MAMAAMELHKNPDLQKLLVEAGFKNLTDLALIDEEMADELVEPRPDLKSDLMQAVARARPQSADGPARSRFLLGREGAAWRGGR